MKNQFHHIDVMQIKQWIKNSVTLFLCLIASIAAHAQTGINPLGQVIQIHTYLHSFVGKPIWTLIIRDVDSGIVYPYIYDFTRTENNWLAFTYGKNYLITVSRLQIESYQMTYNRYKNYRINNFCGLESNGRIMRGMSMTITISGDLSPYSDTYTCQVSVYPDPNFYTYQTKTE